MPRGGKVLQITDHGYDRGGAVNGPQSLVSTAEVDSRADMEGRMVENLYEVP